MVSAPRIIVPTIWISRNAMLVIEYTNRLRSSNRRPRYSDSVYSPMRR